jgi:hypothetical protein
MEFDEEWSGNESEMQVGVSGRMSTALATNTVVVLASPRVRFELTKSRS